MEQNELPPMKLSDIKPYSKELTILIVEDEEPIRIMMVSLFKRIFNRVDEASDGKEGYEKFKANPKLYDIVLTDISMPKLNGIEMTKKIREVDALIPILVLSAHNESEKLIQIINSGADAFLQKPLDVLAIGRGLYKLCMRATDKKLLAQYQEMIEEQNHLLELKNKELSKYNQVLMSKIGKETLSESTLHNLVPLASITQDLVDKTVSKIKTNLPLEENIEYYSLLMKEDIDELIELVVEIENYVFLSFQNNSVVEAYIESLSSRFQKFGSILYRYPMFSNLAGSLFSLALRFNENRDRFIEQQKLILPFLENLIFVLDKYVQDVWEKSTNNPHFYDASIINDIETFLSIIGGGNDLQQNTEDVLEFF